MNNINLDINKYNIKELEKLFKLSDNYRNEDVLLKRENLKTMILESNMTDLRKEELYIFIDNTSNKLQNNLEKVEDNKFNIIEQYDSNHFIIKNKNNNYNSTLENNKQIKKSIIKRAYTIDSLFRSNYTNEDNKSHNYLIELPETITKTITMSMSSIEIPLTYHNISSEHNNNIFRIEFYKEKYDENKVYTDVSNLEIKLTNGIYETNFKFESLNNEVKKIYGINIINKINKEINKKIQENTIPELNENDISFNLIPSGKCRIQINNALFTNFSDILINFNYEPSSSNGSNCIPNKIYQKLGWLLGFRLSDMKNGKVELQENISSKNSSGIASLNYPRYLYIAINDFQASSRNYFSIASNSIVAPNIMGRINIQSILEEKYPYKTGASPGDYNYSQKFLREYFGPTDITKLNISLLDEFGRPFSLNNMDWSFVLTFECFYD